MNIKKNLVATSYGLMLLVVLITPALFMGIFEMSSMAAGAGLVSVACIFMFLINKPLYPLLEKQSWGGGLLIIIIFVIFLQGVLGYFVDNFDYQRYFLSFVFLVIYFLGSFCFIKITENFNNSITDAAINFVFYVMLIAGLLGILKFSPFYKDAASKAVFFYSEPSHFSLSFLPLLLYMIIRGSSNGKILFSILGILIALLLENLTLLVGILFIMFISFPLRLLPYILTFAFSLLGIFGVDYYLDRLNFFGDSSNLSVLVYMQGWERAYLNLLDTNGIGVGFQQFGIIGELGEISEKIKILSGEQLNLYDGGSVSSKLIGEFGVLGLLVIFIYLWHLFRFAKILNNYSSSKISFEDSKAILYFSFFIMYSIDLFVRGTGYFSSSGFMLFASTIWLFINGKFNDVLPMKMGENNLDG